MEITKTPFVNQGAVRYRADTRRTALWQKILAAVIALAFAVALIVVMATMPDFQTWYYILILCALSVLALFLCAHSIYSAVLTVKCPDNVVADDARLSLREGMRYRSVPYAEIGKFVVHAGEGFTEHDGPGALTLELADDALYYDVGGRTKIVSAPNMMKLAEAVISALEPQKEEKTAEEKTGE